MGPFDSSPAKFSVAINYAGGDQTLTLGPARGIYVGGAGNLVCRLANSSSDETFTGLLAGQYYPFAVVKIVQSGSSITNSRALY